jgi:hydroxymethylglutaryl-CoA lyase
MIDYGAKKIEVTSFVNPLSVPQMSDSEDVIKGIKEYAFNNETEILALTLNRQGVEKAKLNGIKSVEYTLSASEKHNMRNSNKTINESLLELKQIVKEYKELKINVTIACAFGSPFKEKISLKQLADLYKEIKKIKINQIGFADSAGTSNPYNTRKILRYLKNIIEVEKTSIHIHDTRGMGIANAYVAIDEGITKFDTSLGGMGGCPFIPGAKGNISTEDFLYMINSIGLRNSYKIEKVLSTAIEMMDEFDLEIDSRNGKIYKNKTSI